MIVLTDIHGNYKTMMALLDQIPAEEKDKGIVVAGDLIDRGPGSREVVQFCIDNNILVVMGNHEEMMLIEGLQAYGNYVKNNTFNYYRTSGQEIWGMNGGVQTLESYIDIKEVDGVKRPVFDHDSFLTHMEWMKKLPYYLEFKDVKNEKDEHLLVTHSSAAGVWHWSDKRRQENKDIFRSHLTWNRDLQINAIKGIFNVFGHTPQENGPKIKTCYANIDTGCFYTRPGYGKLTALQFPEMIVYRQDNIDEE